VKQVNRLAISPDKRFLAAAGHSHVRLYDITSNNPNPIHSFDGHTSNVTGVAFHLETKWMATSSEDGTVKIWDLRSPHVQRDFAHGAPVSDIVVHPNQGDVISCDQAGCVKIWDLAENANTHTLIPEEDVPLRSVTVAHDGSMLIAGNDKVFKLLSCGVGGADGCTGECVCVEDVDGSECHDCDANDEIQGP
jgi:target of rapamycin complex subunit LST8